MRRVRQTLHPLHQKEKKMKNKTTKWLCKTFITIIITISGIISVSEAKAEPYLSSMITITSANAVEADDYYYFAKSPFASGDHYSNYYAYLPNNLIDNIDYIEITGYTTEYVEIQTLTLLTSNTESPNIYRFTFTDPNWINIGARLSIHYQTEDKNIGTFDDFKDELQYVMLIVGTPTNTERMNIIKTDINKIGADAYIEGYEDGYIEGEAEGTDTGYIEGYDEGYDDGKIWKSQQDYDEGYDDGYNDGSGGQPDAWNMIWTAFIGIFSIFAIELLPGLTIGMIAGFFLVIGIIGFIAKVKGKQ